MNLNFKIWIVGILLSMMLPGCVVLTGNKKMNEIRVTSAPAAMSIEAKNVTSGLSVYQGQGRDVTIPLKAKQRFLQWARYDIVLKRTGFETVVLRRIKCNKKRRFDITF
jgi:hypothetical protein